MNRLSLIALLCLVAPGFALAADAPSANATPSWIWAPGKMSDEQVVLFRKDFDLPNGTSGLTFNLWSSCDNVQSVSVNGQHLGFSTEWQTPMSHDVTKHLKQGRNVIAIRGVNQEGSAAMIARLTVTSADKKKLYVVSDASWKTFDATDLPKEHDTLKRFSAPDFDDAAWKPARVIGKLGIQPWGALPGADGKPITATPADQISVLPGFKIDLVYTVPKTTQGSWVAVTVDNKGRLITSDQGGYLYRVTLPAAPSEQPKVEKIEQPIGHAQGLLYAFDSLYVVVNGGGVKDPKTGKQNGSGLYRLTDTDNDDQYDKLEQLTKLNGGGEHGPHALRVGPDGKSLYLGGGNFTAPPQPLNPNSPAKNYAEDHLLVRNPDGGGHDPNVFAPGGWVAKTDKDAKEWTLLAVGLRNTYDIAFNHEGELFNYDSDMEWDTGTPWYRPIRVNHIVSGGEYGWRNGTGKWPEFYPDSLGAVVNTGLGSPVGVEFGYGAKFPAKYQHAFYIQDWSYGTIYAVHITPRGSGYTGTFETFIRGKGFPVTDMTVHPDGNVYVTVGGRGTQSALYRVSYTGTEPTTPVTPTSDPEAAKARAQRHQLEAFHGKVDSAAVAPALAALNSTDRNLRYAARVALEWQPAESWRDQVLAEKRPTALINGAIGLIRASAKAVKVAKSTTEPTEYEIMDKTIQPKVIEALGRLNLKSLSEEQLLEAIRAYGLAFVRLGKPDDATAKAVAAKFDPLFPSASPTVNREVAQLLAYLQAPGVIQKSLDQLAKANTQEDQLWYGLILRNVPSSAGWTQDQRKAYFAFINHAYNTYKGGASFKKFLTRIREDAVKTLTPEEATSLAAVIKGDATAAPVKAIKPRQFVRNWTMSDFPADELATQTATGRNFESGKAAFEAAQCAACHRFAGEGGATGPDLTGVGNRFSATDLLEAIVLPSKVISDQYQTTMIDTADGDTNVGRVATEDADKVLLQTNPLTIDTIEIKKADIKARSISKVSMMPQGLADILTKDEMLDLIAYMRSAGDQKDKAFQK